jgi:hypothetical protein
LAASDELAATIAKINGFSLILSSPKFTHSAPRAANFRSSHIQMLGSLLCNFDAAEISRWRYSFPLPSE